VRIECSDELVKAHLATPSGTGVIKENEGDRNLICTPGSRSRRVKRRLKTLNESATLSACHNCDSS